MEWKCQTYDVCERPEVADVCGYSDVADLCEWPDVIDESSLSDRESIDELE